MVWITLSGTITVISLLFALKKYIDMLIVICVMERRGIEPSDNETRDAARFVIKKLLKLR